MRRRARRAAVVVWLLTLWSVAPAASPAGAIAPDAYGWWGFHQQAPGGSNAPSPPTVPPDGIFVSGTTAAVAGQPYGVLAFGALRATIAEGSPARILLSVADGYTAANAALLACPTTSGWDPFVNGRWEQRPSYDCVRGVSGEPSPTGDTVTFELAGTAQKEPGLLDVAIVPAGPAPVRIAFERPSDSSIQPAMSLDDVDTASEGGAAGDPSSETTFSDGGTFGFDVPLGGALTELPVLGPDAGAGGVPTAPTGGAPQASAPRRFPSPLGLPGAVLPDERGERILALALLLAIGAALWWIGGQPTRPPRRLGSLGGPDVAVIDGGGRVAGVGRFARHRPTSTPNRL